MDLSVPIGPLRLKNPLIAASGCFGYGVEYADLVDLSSLGAVAAKGVFLAEREGHPPPRLVETPAGMLNATGRRGGATGAEPRRPRLSNGMGGLSGPAIRPIAVRMVYECGQAVKLPII